jgi:putative flippase GtrA
MMPPAAARIDRRFLRYVVAGGVNTLFGYAAYSGLVLAGVAPQIALGGGMAAGILFNFFSISAAFASHDRRRLPRFLAVYGLSYLANAWLLGLVVRAGVGPLVAQAGFVLLFTPLTFIAMRRFVFAQGPEPTP